MIKFYRWAAMFLMTIAFIVFYANSYTFGVGWTWTMLVVGFLYQGQLTEEAIKNAESFKELNEKFIKQRDELAERLEEKERRVGW